MYTKILKRSEIILLFIIFLTGVFFRLYNLSKAPASLNWDEAALGYNAYSISLTLKDEYGKTLPVFTRSFDEYKSVLPVYLMIPSVKIFGLNEFGVRFPSAFIGSITVLLVYFLVKKFGLGARVALLSAFLLSIEPWSVHLSRVYHEANIAMFLFLLGYLVFLYSKNNEKLLPFSVLLFMFSMYTYNAQKILVPLFLVILYFLNRNLIKNYPRYIINITIVVLLLFLLPFIYLAIIGEAFARVSSTNIFRIFSNSSSVNNAQLQFAIFKTVLNFLTQNKLYQFVWELSGRYLAYFSPPNLFAREPLEPVTVVAGNSIFYSFEFIPWLLGLIFLYLKRKKLMDLFMLIIISPIPSILTWNWFQPGRTMVLFSVFTIATAIGITEIVKLLKTRIFKGMYKNIAEKFILLAVCIYSLISAFYLFDSVNIFLPFRDSGNYQPGFKETVPVVMSSSGGYKKIVIETPHAQPYIFYLFYSKYDPGKYLNELDLQKIGTPRKSYDFGKLEFRKIYWPDDRGLHSTLFVGNDENLPDKDLENSININTKSYVYDNNGNKVAKIVGLK